MARISSFEVTLCTSFVLLGLLTDIVARKKFPKNSRRWATLSEDTRNRLILRLSQAPPKIFYIWASYNAYVATDEDLVADKDGVRSLALATWLVAAVMYIYELIGTWPPKGSDIVHHVGWVYLTYFAYSSPIATQGATSIRMVRCICVTSFFSLGVNSVILLGLFLMLNLAPWSKPSEVMCWSHSFMTCTLCLARLIEWPTYLLMFQEFWQLASTKTHQTILVLISMVLVGLVTLHRRWCLRSLRHSRQLWQNRFKSHPRDVFKYRTSKRGQVKKCLDQLTSFWGPVLADTTMLMVVGGLALPFAVHIYRAVLLAPMSAS